LVEDSTRTESLQGRLNRTSKAIIILSLASSIIRSELALLLGPLALYLLITRKTSFINLVISGLVGGAGGAVSSVMVDSLFWGRWTWPEVEAVVFNVVQGKSEEWGVSLVALVTSSCKRLGR
jgi:alpha-1,6-mannosyltransferase